MGTEPIEKRLFTVAELAEYLSVKPKTVYAWKGSQEIPPECVLKLGREVRFDRDKIDEWLETKRAG